ncbi:glycosyltransferase family 2 protein [Salinimonas lutimaris]|uniref:glycosyltransferase family 2 protein n=1 Tax=Salinimonas lutimaris TaxID=914153 RepID=UPI0010C0C4D3|nr:glycosyltransferase family 2 protein [Salinimonas lutimaris]
MHPNSSPDAPLVSVIITTYKGADTIVKAVSSILEQTWQHTEVIVVDDNGFDTPAQKQTRDALSALSDARIVYLPHKQNSNGAVARNTGISAARGQYIGFLDDDDLYLPERISRSVGFLQEHPRLAGLCVAVEVHYSAQHVVTVPMHKPITAERMLVDEMSIGTGSNLFFQRRIFDDGLRFDIAFRRHQDLEFMLCVLRKYRIGNLDTVLVVKKSNSNSNIPNYQNFRAAKMMYLNKFQPEIAALSSAQRQMFYKTHFRLLLDIAEQEGKPQNIRTAYKDCVRHRVFYIGDMITLVLGRSRYQALKNKLTGKR